MLEGDGVPDDPFVLVIEQEAESGEQRFLGIGRNVFGQIRVVVYTYRGDSIRYISVRKPVPREVRNYEEGI